MENATLTRTRRWATSNPVVLTGAAMIAAQLGFRGWLLSHAWFQQDDFVFWQRALSSDLDLEYLFTGHVGHFMPAGFLLGWFNNQIDPVLFALPASEMLAMQAMASIACLMVLVHMFGPRWGILPPLAIFLFSPISLPAATWWAAGINQLPLLIVFFAGLHTHVSYLRTRRMRYAWWTMGWTAIGLLFTEKTLVMFEVYAIIALGYFATGHLADRIREIWHGYRSGVVLYSVVVLGFVPFYYFAYINFDAGEVTETSLSGLAVNMVVKAYATGIVGGPLEWWSIGVFNAIAAPSDLLILISWAAIAGTLFAIARTRQRSKRAWLLVVAVLGTNVLLVATGRAFVVGAMIGLEYRYQTEVVAATAVALALSWLPLIGAVESAEPTGKHPVVDSRPFWTGAIALMIVASALSSYRFMGKEFREQSPEAYFANFVRSLPFDGTTVTMMDRAVPEKIWSPISFPSNLYSRMFMPWEEHLEFVDVAHDTISMVDDDGNIRPVLIEPLRRHAPPGRGQQDGCIARVGASTEEIELDGPVIGFGWWIRLGYLAQDRTRVTIEIDSKEYEMDVMPGAHAIYVQADGNYESISVTGTADDREVCFDDLVLGVPQAVDLP